MDDSWDWYNQSRKLVIAAFKAGEIDYQQYVDMNQKALKKFFGNGEKLGCPEKNIILGRQ
jgi:hypothetical protein